MMTTKIMPVGANNDVDLVNGTLAGNRDAFSQIVARYQSLICSLAYSATGSLGQSEDLAQETFITAWKHLGHLRERHKLRAWLCGIARNRINSFLRREGREPIREAEPLENIPESHSHESQPAEQTISNEEQAILWRALERIPGIYREPLVLFYREHQSIESVAEKLELTEDNVKQRLSRGRKLLHEEVLAFVEGALERTNPGKTFTFAVLASLPALTLSAQAATFGAAAAKGGAAAKATSTLGLLGVVASPLMFVFANYIPYRIGLAEAGSDEERGHIRVFYRKVTGVSFALSFALLAVFWLAVGNQAVGRARILDLFLVWFTGFVVTYLLTILTFSIAYGRKRRAFLSTRLTAEHGGVYPKPAFEYCSAWKFLGLPLVHVRIGDRFDFLKPAVKAWIAVSNIAFGGLFAFGGVAVAPISMGGLAVGILPFGGLALGLIPLGAMAMGGWAMGGFVAGWQAVGGCALAWNAAAGACALAHDFALGAVAHAAQANNAAAQQRIEAGWLFHLAGAVNRHLFWLNLLWFGPLLLQWRLVERSRRRESTTH